LFWFGELYDVVLPKQFSSGISDPSLDIESSYKTLDVGWFVVSLGKTAMECFYPIFFGLGLIFFTRDVEASVMTVFGISAFDNTPASN
jgi:hypothetical protein